MTTSDETSAFEFDGKRCDTIGTLVSGAIAAVDAGKAAEFLAAYRAYSPHADANLGYVIGYVEPPEERHRLYAAFAIGHPIFGGAV